MRHNEWGLLLFTVGIARNLWGDTKGKQFTKADTEQTYPIIFYILLKLSSCMYMYVPEIQPKRYMIAQKF